MATPEGLRCFLTKRGFKVLGVTETEDGLAVAVRKNPEGVMALWASTAEGGDLTINEIPSFFKRLIQRFKYVKE